MRTRLRALFPFLPQRAAIGRCCVGLALAAIAIYGAGVLFRWPDLSERALWGVASVAIGGMAWAQGRHVLAAAWAALGLVALGTVLAGWR
jgi:hypothetical protein